MNSPAAVLAVPLALAAALSFAVSDYLQQSTAARLSGQTGSGLRGTLPAMARQPRWWWGWWVGTAAFGLRGAALYVGSIVVVQTLQVTILLFALPLSTIGNPERVRRRDWVAAGAVCLGLALVLLACRHVGNPSRVDRGRLSVMLIGIGCAIVVALLLALLRGGRTRAAALAAAAGMSFAVAAALTKVTGHELTGSGVGATAADWPGYLLAVSTGVGLALEQAAFAAARLAMTATVLVITNPVLGSLLGVVAFDERLPRGPLGLAGVVGGAVAVVAGVTALSRSALLRPAP
jgi:drug/metabolite transporter (DMT)-like permease